MSAPLPPSSDALALLLSQVISRIGEGPIKVSVDLTTSDEVMALRGRVYELETELKLMKERFTETEFLYRCESVVNMRLIDFCKERNIEIPRSLFARPGAL